MALMCMQQAKQQIEDDLPKILETWRATPHSAHGLAPKEIFFGLVTSDVMMEAVEKEKKYVERANERFRDAPSRQLSIEKIRPDGGIRIATSYYPRLTVKVSLNQGLRAIECVFTSRVDRESQEDDERELLFRFAIDAQDKVCTQFNGVSKTNEEIAQLLLSPLIIR